MLSAALSLLPRTALAQGLPPQAASSGGEATTADGGPSAVAAEATPAADGSTAQVNTPGSQPREARDLSLPRPDDKRWQVGGELQYRTLVVRDTDPANDQRMFYRLQAGYEPLDNLILSARAGAKRRHGPPLFARSRDRWLPSAQLLRRNPSSKICTTGSQSLRKGGSGDISLQTAPVSTSCPAKTVSKQYLTPEPHHNGGSLSYASDMPQPPSFQQ